GLRHRVAGLDPLVGGDQPLELGQGRIGGGPRRRGPALTGGGGDLRRAGTPLGGPLHGAVAALGESRVTAHTRRLAADRPDITRTQGEDVRPISGRHAIPRERGTRRAARGRPAPPRRASRRGDPGRRGARRRCQDGDVNPSRPAADASVRIAWAADAEAIAHLQVKAWRRTYADILPKELLAALDEQAFADQWRQSLA